MMDRSQWQANQSKKPRVRSVEVFIIHMLVKCAKILALWKLLTAQLEQHAGWNIFIAMHEHGESRYWLGCSWTNTTCPRCFKYYKYNFWRLLLPHNMLAYSPILISRPPEKCGSYPSRKGMCTINVHPTSSALVLIAPYKGLQGCLRPAACLTLSRAKIDHLTINSVVVPLEQE